MGVKSMDLFVIINVAFFVTKALNLMAMFHNPAWQLCFLFPSFISGHSTYRESLGDVSGCSATSEVILVPEEPGRRTQS